jgi:hypothetical protein
MGAYLLIGAVGGPNFGDEAIINAWIAFIRQGDVEARIFCDGYDLARTAELVTGGARAVTPEQSLWTLAYAAADNTPGPAWQTHRDRFNQEALQAEIVSRGAALASLDLDAIHIVGGGFLNAIWPRNYLILMMARLLADHLEVRLVATGQGLTPVHPEDQRPLVDLLLTFDHVDLRDGASLDLFGGRTSPALTMSGDDALLFFTPGMTAPVRTLDEPALIVCLHNDPLYSGSAVLEEVLGDDVLDVAAGRNIRYVIFVQAMDNDVVGPDAQVAERFRRRGVTYEVSSPRDTVLRDFLSIRRDSTSPRGITRTCSRRCLAARVSPCTRWTTTRRSMRPLSASEVIGPSWTLCPRRADLFYKWLFRQIPSRSATMSLQGSLQGSWRLLIRCSPRARDPLQGLMS